MEFILLIGLGIIGIMGLIKIFLYGPEFPITDTYSKPGDTHFPWHNKKLIKINKDTGTKYFKCEKCRTSLICHMEYIKCTNEELRWLYFKTNRLDLD